MVGSGDRPLHRRLSLELNQPEVCQMKCENCGKGIEGTVVTRLDGEAWCIECVKVEKRKPKKPVRTRSTDPFIKVARSLSSRDSLKPYNKVILSWRGKRIFTSGYVIISEFVDLPVKYKLLDIEYLWEIPKEDRFNYPDLTKIMSKRPAINVAWTVPEVVYQLARAFSTPKPRAGDVRVKFRPYELVIEDSRDQSRMWYGDFSGPDYLKVDIDYLYFMALKSKKITVSEDVNAPLWITESYNEAVDACEIVILKPMILSEEKEVVEV